jgi:PAS domain S-box-containing protein
LDATFIIATSVLMQLVAAVFVLSHMRDIELRRLWLAMGAALLLMCVPRTITLVKLLTGQITQPPALESELVALDVSFLMGIGISYAARLFRSLKRAHTELMESQKNLIARESWMRGMFDNIPDALIVVGRDGVVRNTNRAADALLGWPREQIVGTAHNELALFKQNPPEQRRSWISGNGDQTVQVCESTFRNAQGREVSVMMRGFEMTIDKQELRTWIVTDVTEERGLRAEAERLEAQLRHSERLQTVGTLAGGIAHDFNNILAPIVGYTELVLKESEVAPPSRTHLEQVIRGAMRARDLVRQILTFSRQSTRQTIPVQLQSLIKETLILIRASLPSTIQIETAIDPDCRLVIGDPGQLHQVLMNLCTNAFHAMRETGGTLKVTLRERDPERAGRVNATRNGGQFACLMVEDTGCGIAQAVQDRIFEPFFTTKSEGQGSGLGLSVVYGIVKSHGGSIEVESKPGDGTKFIVYLPLDREHMAASVVTTETAITGTERVLIVDDEPVVAEMVGELLSAYGFRVTHRTSSVEALAAFRANPRGYDAVITDQTMPNLTGIELAAELKRVRGDLPVILMTGFSEQVSADNYRELGIDGYLLKPILASAVTRLVAKLTRAQANVED